MTQIDTEQCARLLLNTIPQVMQTIGAELQACRLVDFTVPQFRALTIIQAQQNMSITRIADQLGTSLSAVSKLIDGLVDRGYVMRDVPSNDRRRVQVTLTALGETAITNVHQHLQGYWERTLAQHTPAEITSITQALTLLRATVDTEAPGRDVTAVDKT